MTDIAGSLTTPEGTAGTRGIIDAHTHLFPDEVIRDRARFLAADSWFGETYGHPKAIAASVDLLIASMDD
ncbi:MAG TPA: hypothetical protein VFQ54_01505, partial [Thermomicrobiales bacterium]|nr:hypothetical protein [Thermomicrobiales bacterium]